jgi:hypothetical protein
MRAFEFSRCVLGIGVSAALLCACGGGSPMPIAADNTISRAGELKHHQTFSYTGAEQTFIVPAGVERLTVLARGGQGCCPVREYIVSSDTPGFPGRVYAVIRVHPGEKLYVFVAGAGAFGQGGFNGGGAGGSDPYKGAGGGGATDVRRGGDSLKDRIIVSAGGGGSGFGGVVYSYDWGGYGGGLVGGSGGGTGSLSNGGGGTGGSQSKGGLGGRGGLSHTKGGHGKHGGKGRLGQGGEGGNGGGAASSYYDGSFGGGGGGGYYGGGGGGGAGSSYSSQYGDREGGGGGGGSSYVDPSAITSRIWMGWKVKGDGQVIFSWK